MSERFYVLNEFPAHAAAAQGLREDVQRLTSSKRHIPWENPVRPTLKPTAQERELASLGLTVGEALEEMPPWERLAFGSQAAAERFKTRGQKSEGPTVQKVSVGATADTPCEAEPQLLFDSIGSGKTEAIHALLAAKMDPNTQKNGLSALYKAAELGDKGAVKLLLRFKADPTIRCAGEDGQLPIEAACFAGQMESCRVLISDMQPTELPQLSQKMVDSHWDIFFTSLSGRFKTMEAAMREAEYRSS